MMPGENTTRNIISQALAHNIHNGYMPSQEIMKYLQCQIQYFISSNIAFEVSVETALH